MSQASGASVSFESVSKRFNRGARHGALSDLIRAAGSRLVNGKTPRRDSFWALRDISFTVGPGEALGIIGPNGSGKSTVLRLLAKILRPDEGHVVVRGPSGRRAKLGALIELDAGFHYELTGRENIYLQGAVLGMQRNEIARRFDEIVEFGELAPFIDTPVKHYSSGMIARLGFSIAAHLDPDILVIDEVLSAGDDAFQRKAFDRIASTVRSDIPAIVVSHQLHRIAELCTRAILLTRGRVIAAGSAAECIDAYVTGTAPAQDDIDVPVRILSLSSPEPASVNPGGRVCLLIRGTILAPGGGTNFGVGLRVRSLPREDLVFVAATSSAGIVLPHAGDFALEIDVQMNVAPGTYRAQAVVWENTSLREVTRGQSVLIAVGGTGLDNGRVFADPRFRLISK